MTAKIFTSSDAYLSPEEEPAHPIIVQTRAVISAARDKWQALNPFERMLTKQLHDAAQEARALQLKIQNLQIELQKSRNNYADALAAIETSCEYLPRP